MGKRYGSRCFCTYLFYCEATGEPFLTIAEAYNLQPGKTYTAISR